MTLAHWSFWSLECFMETSLNRSQVYKKFYFQNSKHWSWRIWKRSHNTFCCILSEKLVWPSLECWEFVIWKNWKDDEVGISAEHNEQKIENSIAKTPCCSHLKLTLSRFIQFTRFYADLLNFSKIWSLRNLIWKFMLAFELGNNFADLRLVLRIPVAPDV